MAKLISVDFLLNKIIIKVVWTIDWTWLLGEVGTVKSSGVAEMNAVGRENASVLIVKLMGALHQNG